jgi:hypothetical protein
LGDLDTIGGSRWRIQDPTYIRTLQPPRDAANGSRQSFKVQPKSCKDTENSPELGRTLNRTRLPSGAIRMQVISQTDYAYLKPFTSTSFSFPSITILRQSHHRFVSLSPKSSFTVGIHSFKVKREPQFVKSRAVTVRWKRGT